MPTFWCFLIVVLEKTLESPLNCKEIKPVNPKENQSWIFIRKMDAETEAPILWSPDVESRIIRKDPNAEKEWRQEKKGTTEDEMIGWHCWFKGHEFEQAPGNVERQGILVCCRPWGHKESDMNEQLNNKCIYFAVSGLSCDPQAQWWWCSVACGILVCQLGIKLVYPASQGRFLTTGLPGKSLNLCFN